MACALASTTTAPGCPIRGTSALFVVVAVTAAMAAAGTPNNQRLHRLHVEMHDLAAWLWSCRMSCLPAVP